MSSTVQNTEISPNFQVKKFCRNAQITRKSSETVCFYKIFAPGNYVK